MTEENVFVGPTKVMTKSYGTINDRGEDNRDQAYQSDDYAAKDSKMIIFKESRFISVGNATFLVGIPYASFFGDLWSIDADDDAIKDIQHIPKDLWIPFHDIISITSSQQED